MTWAQPKAELRSCVCKVCNVALQLVSLCRYIEVDLQPLEGLRGVVVACLMGEWQAGQSVHLAFTKQKIILQVNISTTLRYFIAISIQIESADAGL